MTLSDEEWMEARKVYDHVSDSRSADMEARIRAWATEAYSARQWDLATRLRALLDAAPAGGAEVERLRSVIDGTETVIHAPSEVPHQHGGTDAPECTTCAPQRGPS